MVITECGCVHVWMVIVVIRTLLDILYVPGQHAIIHHLT